MSMIERLVLPTSDELVAVASAKLIAAFRREFAVPEPSEDLFEDLERLEGLGIRGFKPNYQPEVQLGVDDPFWDGSVKPQNSFWKQVEKGNYPEDTTRLKGGWYLGDTRIKPHYRDGQQVYEDDYMALLMKHLRTQGRIGKCPSVPDNSRFGATPREIEDIILPEFARRTEVTGTVRNRRYMEFNALGNKALPELGRTTTWEWFGDQAFRGGRRLLGGYSRAGGLAGVHDSSVDDRSGIVGFSPVLEYPSKS